MNDMDPLSGQSGPVGLERREKLILSVGQFETSRFRWDVKKTHSCWSGRWSNKPAGSQRRPESRTLALDDSPLQTHENTGAHQVLMFSSAQVQSRRDDFMLTSSSSVQT